MDIIIGIVQALMALLGWVDEQQAIKDRCAEFIEAGAIPYPPPADVRKALEDCKPYFEDEAQ